MDLTEIVGEIRSFPGITRKLPVAEVIKALPLIPSLWYPEGRMIASFGEDAAVIELGTQWLLLAADGVWESVLRADPRWAGYCSILVNVNDIAAMGGTPLAAVNVISMSDSAVQILKGVREGVEKFGVPIVGGHTHPGCSYNAIDVAILGTVGRGEAIYSHTAQVGDKIIFAIDLDGRIHPNSPYSWDSTSDKSPDVVRQQVGVMGKLGRRKILTAGKDISNPGSLGTLGMLLETSGKGASVDLREIPRPENVPLVQWLKLYPGAGFVVTCRREATDEVIHAFGKVGLSASVAGNITEGHRLSITDGASKRTLFDFKTDRITGIRPITGNRPIAGTRPITSTHPPSSIDIR